MSMNQHEPFNMPIAEFSGPCRFLSNFWPAEVWFDGDIYPSVEHAYQAAKTTHMPDREEIRRAHTAGVAKHMGRYVRMRPDWEEIKLEIMHQLVAQKFTFNADLRRQLLATGQRELIEGNHWGDTFWGVCRGKGQNNLGKILMAVRADLRR